MNGTPAAVAAAQKLVETGHVEIDRAGRHAVGEEQPDIAGKQEGDARRVVARMQRYAEHVAPEGERRIEIAAGGQSHLPDRSDVWHDYMEKLVPQPQEATAFGFLIWNDWPIRSSTKSITEPPI